MPAMKKRSLLVSLLLVLLTGAVAQAALELKPVWRHPVAEGRILASPTLWVDGTTRGAIICTERGAVTLLGADGRVTWCYASQGARIGAAAVGDLDRDGHPETVSGTRAHEVTCLDHRGKLRWRALLPGEITWTTPVIADLTGDRRLEVAAADGAGFVGVFDSGGRLLWRVQVEAGCSAPLSAADVDGDGRQELLVTDDGGSLSVLGGDGTVRWVYQRPHINLYSAATAADLDGDGRVEVLDGYDDGRLVCLDGPTGRLRWSAAVGEAIDSTVSVADLDGDRRLEVLVGDREHGLTCLDAAGSRRWQLFKEKGNATRVVSAASVGDLNGDGLPEIAVGLSDGNLLVLDRAGQQLASVPAEGNFNTTPLLADLNGDGILEVVAAGRRELVCLAGGGPGRAQWAGYRNSPQLTGAARSGKRLAAQPRPAPQQGGPAWRLGGIVGAEVALVVGPMPASGLLEARLVRPDGVVFGACRHVERGQSVQVPFRQWVSGEYRITTALRVGARVQSRAGSMRLQRFAQHLAAIDRDCSRAAAVQARLSKQGVGVGAALRARLLVIESEASRLAAQGAAGQLDQAAGMLMAGLVSDARDLAATATALAGVRANSPLLIWQANPWQPFTQAALPPAGAAEGALAVRPLYQDEVQPICVNLLNVNERTLGVRVIPGDLEAGKSSLPWQQHLRLLTLRAVGSRSLREVWDALPPLGVDRVLEMPSLEARQLWLMLDTTGLPPGKYRLPVTLASTEQWHRERRLSLDFEVLPLSLKEGRALRFCQWGYFYMPGNYLSRCQEAAVADLVSHGTNVFVFEGNALPKMTFDQEGNLQGTDWQDHDRLVRLCSPHGILLLCGYTGYIVGTAPGTQAYWRAYGTYVREVAKHLSVMGLDYRDWALYPVDEPGLSKDNARAYIEYAKAAKAADPRVQMYTDPVPGMTLAELREAAPYTDIWCPNGDGIVMRAARTMDFLRSTGAQLWTYRCSGGAKTELSMTTYYRNAGWMAWQAGLTGVGFWTYCTTQYQPWQGDQDEEGEYALVYPGEAPVSSRRWEAALAGLQDYRALDLLRQAVAAAQGKADAATLRTANDLLAGIAIGIALRQRDDGGAAMEKCRRQISELTLRLRAAVGRR